MKIRWRVLGLLLIVLPRAGVAQPPGSQAGNAYALIIGVGAYPQFPLGDRLRYATRDAEAFRDFLRSPQGGQFAEERIRFLTEASATRGNIYREIRWLERRVRPDDRVYVFFTGHGLVPDGGSAYLMPYDADPDDPSGLGIRADQFVTEIRNRVAAGRVLFFIDACHSAAALIQGGVAKGTENVVPTLRDVWSIQANGPAVSLGFFSASANQLSWEDDTLQHGVFTYFLLKGLRGGADGHSDGTYDNVVTSGELRSFLTDSVGVYSRRKFQPQEPAFSPVWDGTLALSTVPTPVRPVPPASSQPILPSGSLGTAQWRPAAPSTFTRTQTRDYLVSLGTLVFEDDFEPRTGVSRGGYQSDSLYLYYAGGMQHVDSRRNTDAGASFPLAANRLPLLENYILHLSIVTISADTTKPASFYIWGQRDSANYFIFSGYSGGGPSMRGKLNFVLVRDGRNVGQIACAARTRPLYQAANVYIRNYRQRLQIWYDDTLCVDTLTGIAGMWQFNLGANGFVEVAYDDVVLVRLP